MKQVVYNSITGEDLTITRYRIADFLHEHLEQYGDSRDAILKALEYAYDRDRGGLVIVAIEDDEIVGTTVINFTGMEDYIPANILVYIAVHKEHRGKGIGKQMMENAIKLTKGGIALHVEPENPARGLYEHMGFTSKYVEMRYT